MAIDITRPVKDIVAEFPAAARLFERTGIDYCCGGEKSLRDACKDAEVSAEQIAQTIESVPPSEPLSNEKINWSEMSLPELIEYIVNNHHAYCRREQERLTPLLDKVVQVHGANHPELARIQSAFKRMAHDLPMHLVKEESTLFPMIIRMEHTAAKNEPMPKLAFGSIENPVSMMVIEHDECGRALKEMRSLSHDYEPPADACSSYRNLYQGLKEFELDMHQHIYAENYVLFPRTIHLEKQLAARPAP